MRVFVPPDPAEVRVIREEFERPLTAEELRVVDAIPLGPEELEENVALIEWFCRRYPTPEERMRYARRAYRRWKAAMPNGGE
jgi:hypothetical protein